MFHLFRERSFLRNAFSVGVVTLRTLDFLNFIQSQAFRKEKPRKEIWMLDLPLSFTFIKGVEVKFLEL